MVGADEVSKIACGVSSSRELFERAGEAGAQLVLVHHGLFWRNEPLLVDRRLKGRLEALFAADLTLIAYHLALDAHAEVGNNALLADLLGATREGEFASIGVGARFDEPVTIGELAQRLEQATGRAPLVFAEGPDRIERVAVVTGGGGTRLIEAAHEGYDALVTGEPEEPALADRARARHPLPRRRALRDRDVRREGARRAASGSSSRSTGSSSTSRTRSRNSAIASTTARGRSPISR